MKPTEGPYVWLKENYEGRIYYRLSPGILVTDLTDGTPWGDEIDQANARLLAKSWELREALRDLVAFTVNIMEDGTREPAAVKRALSLLREIEGESE